MIGPCKVTHALHGFRILLLGFWIPDRLWIPNSAPWIPDSAPWIPDFTTWIPDSRLVGDSGFRSLDSGFHYLDSGLQIGCGFRIPLLVFRIQLLGFRIPDRLWIPDSRKLTQDKDSGFLWCLVMDSTVWILDFEAIKIGFWIPGLPYMGRK
jgi:hypothetical protein